MTAAMDPRKVYEHLRDTYWRYLETSFQLKDPSLRKAFEQVIRDASQPPLVRQPILEVSPAYEDGHTLEELVSEGLLSDGFSRIERGALPRRLYVHQERGLRKAIAESRNLVIATGTGSGKTEVFLLPILEHLLREQEAGSLASPGVRALLLYPMNALANDQLERLRGILRVLPEITFGRYTGETEHELDKARNQYISRYGEEPMSNELVCREQMRETPPHILLTNYAMLEYLLIRPHDSALFDGDAWRFVVLDEVHTYAGATGIEIAMLLRRLKERVVRSEPGRLQCFATSATLGSGDKDHPRIARFASTLFGERFDSSDVVGATFRTSRIDSEPWGAGTAKGYSELRKLVSDDAALAVARLAEVARAFFPAAAVDTATAGLPDGPDEDRCRVFLGRLLAGDERLQRLRATLAEKGAVKLDELDAGGGAVDLVALGAYSEAPDGSGPLLAARYHIMARAISGVYAWLDAAGRLHLLSRRARSFESPKGEKVTVFEIGSCNRCGEVFLVGVEEEGFLRQPPDVGDDPVAELAWFCVRPTGDAPEVDEDDAVEAEEDLGRLHLKGAAPMRLCRVCGRLGSPVVFASGGCEGHASSPVEVFKLDTKRYRSAPRSCPSCKNIYGSVASRVFTGREAPVAVLATALYQQVPPSPKDDERRLPGGGRKLLAFSDSRQDAAFFAPFMARTYGQLKQRRYLAQALEQASEPVDLGDWARRARKEAEKADEWDEIASASTRRKDAGRWVLREWTARDRRVSLEGAGVVLFHLRRPPAFADLAALAAEPWGLDSDEQWALIQILLDTLRSRGVVSFDDGDGTFEDIDHKDPIFEPPNRPSFLRRSSSLPKKGIFAWAPQERRTNKRLDYLRRVLERRGVPASHSEPLARAALGVLWETIQHRNGPLAPLFEQDLAHRRESNLMQLHPAWWQVSLAGDEGVLRCSTCGTVASVAVAGVCPMTGCAGALVPYLLENRRRNHYFSLFEQMTPIPLEVREHTAQLERGAAYTTQQDFVDGKVNMLSCTTTFEMGVDVGDLHTVLMRNVPPTPGNYVQRGGRAGRRAHAAAVIVTYAQRRTHDFAYFEDWQRLVRGTIRPPAIRLANAKIVRRHVHAEALAEYFRHNPEVFRDRLESVFDPETRVPEEILGFLRQRPRGLEQRLARVVPEDLHSDLGIRDWAWLGDDGAEEGTFAARLVTAQDDVRSDWDILAQAEEEASRARKHDVAHHYQKQLKTLKRRSLLGKLGTYGLMPKYGFPTEVVELKVRSSRPEAARIELERDMKLALTEFAPENEVVAAGLKWSSVGIVLPAGDRKLHEFLFWSCPMCHFFAADRIVAIEDEDTPSRMCHCGDSRPARRYVYPEFGFTTGVAAGDRVGDSRPPARSYAGSFFNDDSEEEHFEPVFGVPQVEHRRGSHGWIHVINDNRERDFHVCMWCGFAARLDPRWAGGKETASHLKPWSAQDQCSGGLRKLALGYRYRTDVLELRFPSRATEHLDRSDRESLWLSLLFAIVNGSCQELEIHERDIGGCLHFARRDHPSLILYDTSPGGAGFVNDVRDNLKAVLHSARRVLACTSCAEDSSCIACLRSYGNQRDHNKLRRGLAAEYLETVLNRT